MGKLILSVIFNLMMALVPYVVVFSFLGSLISLGFLIFSSSWLPLLFLAFFSLVCFVSVKIMQRAEKKAAEYIAKLNSETSLEFDHRIRLGSSGATSTIYLAFDKKNRKIAACWQDKDEYKIYDFSHVLGWEYSHGISSSMEMAGANYTANGLPVPTFRERHKKTGFKVILNVNDPIRPQLYFMMSGEKECQTWMARLNAIFNGS